MSVVASLMSGGVRDGVFPYGEWTLFDRNGIVEEGATDGSGGRWFDLASLTKTFTATAVLTLVKRGDFTLDTPAGGVLRNVRGALAGRLESVTLRELLTHTARWPAWYPFYADGRPFFEILEGISCVDGMVYSDIGYMLLREVLCAATGLAFEEVIRRHAMEPLGIRELCFDPDRSLPLVPSCRDNAVEERMCAERGMSFDGFRAHCTDVIGEPNDGNAS